MATNKNPVIDSADTQLSAASFVAKGDLLTASAPSTLSVLTVGADGKVLVADAASAGGMKWDTAPAGGAGAFNTTGNVTSNSPGTLATDDFVFGSNQLDDDGDAGHDSRFLFDKSKAFFAAGTVDSTQWDEANRGTASVAFGQKCKASGDYCLSGGSQVDNDGDYTFAYGGDITVTSGGTYGAAIGGNHTISASYVTAFGNGHTMSGEGSAAFGRSHTVSAKYATGHGYYAKADHYGELSQASGRFAAVGDAQTSSVVWRCTTTDSTAAVEMFLDGAGAAERFTLAADTTYAFDILLVARRTDANDESAAYHFLGVLDNNAGTTALVGSVTKVVLAEDTGGWDADVTADNGNDSIKIGVTGEDAKSINWVAHGRLTKVLG